MKIPKTKEDLIEIIKLHGKVKLYCEDFSNHVPGLSSSGGHYGYWAETGPISLENIDEVVWRFHTTYDAGSYCSLCGDFHHESRCHLNDDEDGGYLIFDSDGNIKYPYDEHKEVVIAVNETED